MIKKRKKPEDKDQLKFIDLETLKEQNLDV